MPFITPRGNQNGKRADNDLMKETQISAVTGTDRVNLLPPGDITSVGKKIQSRKMRMEAQLKEI